MIYLHIFLSLWYHKFYVLLRYSPYHDTAPLNCTQTPPNSLALRYIQAESASRLDYAPGNCNAMVSSRKMDGHERTAMEETAQTDYCCALLIKTRKISSRPHMNRKLLYFLRALVVFVQWTQNCSSANVLLWLKQLECCKCIPSVSENAVSGAVHMKN